MASLKKQFSDQAYKQNNVDNTVIEGNLAVEEIPKESKNGEIHILDDSFTIVQTMGVNQNTNHNYNENYFALQLQEYKEKHSSNYSNYIRFHKQTERDSPLLEDSCIVVQRKDANQINNRNNNKKRTQRLQRYEENQCGNLTRFHKKARINNKNYKARMRKAHHHAL